MKKRIENLFRVTLLTLACALSSLSVKAADVPSDLTQFYSYTDVTGGYKVALTDAFKAEVNKATGGTFTQGDYTWTTGAPLPNPAPNGMHDGKAVVDMSRMFKDCSGLTSLDLSKFDTSKVTDRKSVV